MKSLTKGYVLGAVAAVSYGTNPLFAVPLYDAGLSVGSVLFYRYIIATLLLGLVMVYRHASFSVTRRQAMLLVAEGILFGLSSVGLFEAYRYMDVGIASTMLFVEPVMIALLLWVFWRERISVRAVVSIAVSLVGVAFLCNPGEGANVSALGVVLVMASALSYGLYMILINKTSLQRLSGLTLTFWSLLFGNLVMIAKVGFFTQLQPIPADMLSVACALGLSVFPTIVSILTVAVAVRIIGSVAVSILGALEPVTGVAVGVLVFGEVMTLRVAAGCVLILVAVTVLVTGKRRSQPEASAD
ncbi:MAG: DMT family transporter [Duncaniella sp.]|nr:DMT family transporter [Duncaniella sp.]